MSLPARKQKGASRRRKKQARLRQVGRRLLGLHPRAKWNGDFTGTPVLADVLEMIRVMEVHRRRP